jgi:hypothetical protein
MKSLFIAPNESVYVVDVEDFSDVHTLIGKFDVVSLGDNLLMAVNDFGLPGGLPPNPRATLFVATLIGVPVPISGSAIVFTGTKEDLNLKALPEWVQHAVAAPFN